VYSKEKPTTLSTLHRWAFQGLKAFQPQEEGKKKRDSTDGLDLEQWKGSVLQQTWLASAMLEQSECRAGRHDEVCDS
jgi:hypothetical protein